MASINANYNYGITFQTLDGGSGGTDSEIHLTMYGETGKVDGRVHLNPLVAKEMSISDVFEKGTNNYLHLRRAGFGRIVKIKIESDGSYAGSDWSLDKVLIRNYDNSVSTFNVQTTITGDEGSDGVVRTANGYPWPVQINVLNDKNTFQRRYSVEVNDSSQAREVTLVTELEGVQQIEISDEQVSGTTISPALTYKSPAAKYGGFEAAARATWDRTVTSMKVQKDSEGYLFKGSRKLQIPANTIVGVEKVWTIPEFEGKITESNRSFAIRGLKDAATDSWRIFTIPIGGGKKLPYRFRKYLENSGSVDLLTRVESSPHGKSFTGSAKPISTEAKLDALFNQPTALLLDGRTSYAAANMVCSKITNSTFGFGCWACPLESNNDDQTLMAFNTARGENNNMIGFDAQRKAFFYFDPQVGYVHTQGVFRFDTWYHVYAEVKVGEMKLFVNGEEVISAPTTVRPDHSGSFSIGQEWDGTETSDFFNGMIAEARVWNKGLGRRGIQENYRNRISGNEEGLVAYYPMDEESGDVLTDHSMNMLHAKILGTTEWATDTNLPI